MGVRRAHKSTNQERARIDSSARIDTRSLADLNGPTRLLINYAVFAQCKMLCAVLKIVFEGMKPEDPR